jgi:hypothetical protein
MMDGEIKVTLPSSALYLPAKVSGPGLSPVIRKLPLTVAEKGFPRAKNCAIRLRLGLTPPVVDAKLILPSPTCEFNLTETVTITLPDAGTVTVAVGAGPPGGSAKETEPPGKLKEEFRVPAATAKPLPAGPVAPVGPMAPGAPS